MAQVLANVPTSGDPFISGVQFGNRFFMVQEATRPMYIQMSGCSGNPKVYQCGIKPPLTGPTLTMTGGTSTRLAPAHNAAKIRIAYSYYSSVRNVFSRMSKFTEGTMTNPAQKVTITGFENPRDGGQAADIDKLVISAQLATASGFMTLWPDMLIDISDYDFTGESVSYDIPLVADSAGGGLVDGFNMSAQDPYNEVPPACKYVVRHGERIWYGGQRDKVEFANTGVNITKDVAYRDLTLSTATMTGEGLWDDSHLNMSLIAGEIYFGEIIEIKDNRIAFLDRNSKANFPAVGANSTHFRLEGHNDRLYPSSYHQYNPGGVPVTYPETVRLIDRLLMTEVLDEGKKIRGLQEGHDFINVVFRDSASIVSGGNEVNVPMPEIRVNQGRTGAIAQRSISKDQSGSVVWVGEEGLQVGATGGVQSLAHSMGIDDFFKGERGWIDKSKLKDVVMSYSRFLDGFVLGNLTINGTANNYALITTQPQPGLCPQKTMPMTSNIIEYDNSDGRGTMLVGNGKKLMKLFDNAQVKDANADDTSTAAYVPEFRTGWLAQPDGRPFALSALELVGLIIPDESTVEPTITIDHWFSDYPVRLEADIPSKTANRTATGGSYTKTVLITDLRRKIPLSRSSARYHSISVRWDSDMGSRSSADRVVGIELTRMIIHTTQEVEGG